MSEVEVPLYRIAHGRAGDKGNRANISVVLNDASLYPVVASQITAERVLALFEFRGATACRRYDLPNLAAFNFVIDDVLEGGVNGSLNLDGHGKSQSFRVLDLTVRIPA